MHDVFVSTLNPGIKHGSRICPRHGFESLRCKLCWGHPIQNGQATRLMTEISRESSRDYVRSR